jgi:hypothetical protein
MQNAIPLSPSTSVINLSTDQIIFSSPNYNTLLVYEWKISFYPTKSAYTISITTYPNLVDPGIVYYLQKTTDNALSWGIKNGIAYNPATIIPINSLLWTINITEDFFTLEYKIGSIETLNKSAHFDESFQLVAGPTPVGSFPFRFQTQGIYQN